MINIFDDTFNKEVGQRIRSARKNKDMTMKDLGKKVNLSEATIQRYENGLIKNVDINLINKLSEFLDVSSNYLMGFDETILDSEFEEMISFLSRYGVNVKYVEDRTRGEQFEIITYKGEEFGEIGNELFNKYLEIKDLSKENVIDELQSFFKERKPNSKNINWQQYDKDHKANVEKINEDLAIIEKIEDPNYPADKRVIELAKLQNLSINELEKLAEIPQGTIKKWNQSGKNPILPILEKISNVLDIPTSYLINGKKDKSMLMVARKSLNLSENQYKIINNLIDDMIKNNK